jgi:Zn-finger nucleic acid-binding protein
VNTAQGLLCPTCKVDLVMSERQTVEIDYCPKCRGVWLDRGELDKIIERAVKEDAPQQQPAPQPSYSAPPPPPRDHYRDRDDDHRYDKHRKYGHRRKSWLEEIFD